MNIDTEKLRQFISDLNKEPISEHVKKNDDGSSYIPISVTQTLLDDIFLGQWNFEMLRDNYGRKWARGYGRMTCINPVSGFEIVRGGDAGILLTGNVRQDSPRLEAMVLLSCARKFGKVFGRDLNRTKDDAPLSTIKLEKVDFETEEKRTEALIEGCTDFAELKSYQFIIPKSLQKKFDIKLGQLKKVKTPAKQKIELP